MRARLGLEQRVDAPAAVEPDRDPGRLEKRDDLDHRVGAHGGPTHLARPIRRTTGTAAPMKRTAQRIPMPTTRQTCF